MAYTDQIPVTNAAATAVIANECCKNIRVCESLAISGTGTVDFLVYKPDLNSIPVRMRAGADYYFNSPTGVYANGQKAGYIQMVSSWSTEFDQDEDHP
jgi:heme-binding NEAT domain protein